MTQTRRKSKGGAATPDIFTDPFAEKVLPDAAVEKDPEITKYEKSIDGIKRALSFFYAKMKGYNIPDPLNSTTKITEEQREEIKNALEDFEKKQTNHSDNFKKLSEIVFHTDLDTFNKQLQDFEIPTDKETKERIPLSNGLLPESFMGSISRSKDFIKRDFIETIYYLEQEKIDLEKSKLFGLASEENIENKDNVLYENKGIYILNENLFLFKEPLKFLSSKSFLFLKDNTLSSKLLPRNFHKYIIISKYLFKTEWLKNAWKVNAVAYFTKNIGDFMRSTHQSLDVWNTSKWITLANSSYLPNLSLWKERFVWIDKEVPENHEYINFLDIEEYLGKDDTIKEKDFQEIKDEILVLQSLIQEYKEIKEEKPDPKRTGVITNKKYLKKEEIDRQKEKINYLFGQSKRQVHSYDVLAENRILLMDPETMFWIYTKAPALWEYKRYEDIPEQNLKMIFLLQYVRILADFQKKKGNKFSGVKSYQGIGLLKDSFHDIKIQQDIQELLENQEVFDRFLEKQGDLYKGYEIPIGTMDALKGFLSDITKSLGLVAKGEPEKDNNNSSSETSENLSNGEENSNSSSETSENLSNGEENTNSSSETSENSSNSEENTNSSSETSENSLNSEENTNSSSESSENKGSVAPPVSTNFLHVMDKSYYKLDTQTFPYIENQIIKKYPDAKGGAEQIEDDPRPLKLPDVPGVVQIRSIKTSGNKNDCLIHAFLLDMSPAFRRLEQKDKNAFADEYRRQVFPTFYTEEEKADKLKDFNLIQSESFLNDRHAVKLAQTFKVNMLAFEKRPEGIQASDICCSLKDRPYIIIYNPGDLHFRGVQNKETKGFLFTKDEVVSLIEKYGQATPPEGVVIEAAREKEKALEALKEIESLILSKNKQGDEGILSQLKDAQEQYEIVNKITDTLGNIKQKTSDEKKQMLADAKKAAAAAQAALAEVKKIIESAVVPAAETTQGGRRKHRTTRKKNRS